MRILFFNYEYPPLGGGAGNATQYLMREFEGREDLEIDVLTSSSDNSFRVEKLNGNVSLYKLAIGDKRGNLKHQSQKDLLTYTWKAFWFARRLMREKKYDLSHAFFTVPCGALSWWFRLTRGLPYIVSLRGSDVPGYNETYETIYAVLKPFFRSIWKGAAHVVSNSEGLKELALKTRTQQKIDVIYNGVDIKTFTPGKILTAVSTSVSIKNERVTLFCASRLMKRKGFRYVVEAFSMLAEKYPELRLVIAGGDGDASDDLRAQVKALNLGERITFSGEYTREDLVKLQYRSDIFLLPSFNEGMSNSLLEAMAGGLPVLMTPTGGAEELIQNGENGYIVKFGDARDIAEKVEKLLQDPKLREKMGKKSREKAESMSWEKVADEYHEMYKDIL